MRRSWDRARKQEARIRYSIRVAERQRREMERRERAVAVLKAAVWIVFAAAMSAVAAYFIYS